MSDLSSEDLDRIARALMGDLPEDALSDAEARVAGQLSAATSALRAHRASRADTERMTAGVLAHAAENSAGLGAARRVSARRVSARRVSARRVSARRVSAVLSGTRMRIVAATAMIVLLVAAGYGIRQATPPPTRPGATRYTTQVAQQMTIVLGDGSRVTLAPASTLIARGDRYGGRHLAIDGEGSFNVVPNAAAPFTVAAGDLRIRVLGTSFVVRNGARNAVRDAVRGTPARVIVTQGRVAVVRTGRREQTITAGYVAEAADSGVAVRAATSVTDDVAWARDRLVFRRAPLRDVLASLAQWYGYDFQLGDSTLAERTVTAALSTRAADDAFTTLTLILAVDVTVDGNHVTLSPRRGRRVIPAAPQDWRDFNSSTTELGR